MVFLWAPTGGFTQSEEGFLRNLFPWLAVLLLLMPRVQVVFLLASFDGCGVRASVLKLWRLRSCSTDVVVDAPVVQVIDMVLTLLCSYSSSRWMVLSDQSTDESSWSLSEVFFCPFHGHFLAPVHLDVEAHGGFHTARHDSLVFCHRGWVHMLSSVETHLRHTHRQNPLPSPPLPCPPPSPFLLLTHTPPPSHFGSSCHFGSSVQ